MHFQAGYYVVNRRYIKRVCPFKNSLTLGVKIPLTLLNVSLISVWRQCYSSSCEKLCQSHLWQYFISLNLTSVQLLWLEENYNNNIRRVLLLSETCSKIRKYSSQKFFLCILLKLHLGNAVYTDLFSFRYWMLFSSILYYFLAGLFICCGALEGCHKLHPSCNTPNPWLFRQTYKPQQLPIHKSIARWQKEKFNFFTFVIITRYLKEWEQNV